MAGAWGRIVPYCLAAFVAVGVGYLYLTKDGESQTAVPSAIPLIVTDALTTTHPENCTKIYTAAFQKQLRSEESAREALEDCREAGDGEPLAGSVELLSMRTNGDMALVRVHIEGGPYGPADLKIRLRRRGSWRLDRILAIDISKPAFFAAQRASYKDDIPDASVNCLLGRLRPVSEAALEVSLIDGRSSDSVSRRADACVGTPLLRQILREKIEESGVERGVPAPVAECVSRRVPLELTPSELQALDSPRTQKRLASEMRRARQDCEYTYAVSQDGGSYAPAPSTAGPMSRDWREFADTVDQICAVNFNRAMYNEAVIEQVGEQKGWSEDHEEAVAYRMWSASQADTYRMTGRLGTPPRRAALFQRWRENVAFRGRLMKVQARAWDAGDDAVLNRNYARIHRLKLASDRLGQRFGLRICTSN